MLKKLILCATLSMVTLLTLQGCATNTHETTHDFCAIYTPVYTAHEDTELTKKQNDQNNASYDCLCKGGECPDPDK